MNKPILFLMATDFSLLEPHATLLADATLAHGRSAMAAREAAEPTLGPLLRGAHA